MFLTRARSSLLLIRLSVDHLMACGLENLNSVVLDGDPYFPTIMTSKELNPVLQSHELFGDHDSCCSCRITFKHQ